VFLAPSAPSAVCVKDCEGRLLKTGNLESLEIPEGLFGVAAASILGYGARLLGDTRLQQRVFPQIAS